MSDKSGNTQNFSINEGDGSIARLAPVSIRAGDKLTEVFSELSQSWKKYTEIEEGDRIGAIIKDMSVEEQIERMESMGNADLLNVLRFNLRKISTLKEENDTLTSRNRDLFEQLHRVEHRVGKAQNEVFDKMFGTVRQVVDDFHGRELDLARKLESANAEISVLTGKNSKLEGKVKQFEDKVEDLENKLASLIQKNQNLTSEVQEKEKVFDQLARKYDEQSEELYRLQEQLEETQKSARDCSDQAVKEAIEAQNLRILVVKEKDAALEKALRHEEMIKKDMDAYKEKCEGEMAQMRRRCKEEIEAMTKRHRTESFQQDSRIELLAAELEKKKAEVAKFERHLTMMEAQIRGNMKRSLAVNYQEMLNVISAGPSHVPTPPTFENPLIELARDLEAANKENQNKRRHNSIADRSSCPPSPKRTVAVQASQPEPPRVVRRPMPPSFLSRKPSTSSGPFHRK